MDNFSAGIFQNKNLYKTTFVSNTRDNLIASTFYFLIAKYFFSPPPPLGKAPITEANLKSVKKILGKMPPRDT